MLRGCPLIRRLLPSGVVTFLFTDVEGSTRRWEADADEMRAALAAHDEVLRAAIEAHGGWLFKHTGDGVCAAFASPRSAVDAAVAAQRSTGVAGADGDRDRRSRAARGRLLRCGAQPCRAGDGRRARRSDSAGRVDGGSAQRSGAAGSGAAAVARPADPGRGVSGPSAGLRTDFPPLRALDASPGNLRPQLTSFIGRESEVAEVQAALRTHRLVTLTGVGGVGKTRLALEVAAHLVDEFPDGVWFFELAAVADPAAVPDAVAAVLGITQQPGKTVSESVAAALEGRVRLLVLDNCEHVRDAAADLVEAILAPSATVRILATSREGLGVADEQLWLVPSLDVGAGIDSAAVNLFVERARSVAPRFSLANAEEAGAVVEICRRLDGIPLAIELAASRMASMTASEVRDRLDQRFRLLVGSRRGLARHHTLRHAVAWSYDLLDDAEKTLLERCSVFAGGFDLQSACAVAGFDDADDYAVARSAGRAGAQVAARRRPVIGADPVFDAGDDPPVRRGATRRPRRGRPRSGPRMLATSPGAKPTSWPCGTAPGSATPTTGSPPNWPTCAPRFGGLPTRAISTSPPPSRRTRRSSACVSKVTSPSLGPKN